MNRTLYYCLLPALIIFASFSPIFAAEKGLLLTEEVQVMLGDSFMAEREYYRAVTEYKKFLVLFPDSEQSDSVLFKIGRAYQGGDEFENAARSFAAIGERYPDSTYAPAAGYQAGLCYWRLNRLDEAAAAFTAVATHYPASGDAPRALLETALVDFDRKDLPGSRRELERFLATYPQDQRAEKARDAITLLDRDQQLPRKSPVVAGLLSAVVPGAGHIYAGHYGDGVTSFFLNGLFIAGTVVAIRQENYAVAGAVGVVGLPFYIGNIYGAANAATKWNISIRKELRGAIAVTLDSPF
jgi:outer membrane protein assembly factor BamD (BamD/ComL family)/TM2 domain-containing membrane protein YozV